MLAPALLPLVLVAAAPQFAEDRSPDPAVQVWLDSEARYERGDLARVFARTARDGYLVVLHADTEGRVRVLFPLDPWLDNFVRGGEGIELRTRGDREAFLVEERDGSGVVLAAWSADPFRFDAYVRGDHWDYRSIAPQGVLSDPEAALLDIVHTMAAGRRYDYDVAPYLVGADAYDYAEQSPVYVERSPVYVNRWSPHIDWRVGFGTHAGFYLNVSIGNTHWYDPWYDPWYYHDSWWIRGPRYVVRYPVWYRPVYYDPFFYSPIYRPRYTFWDPYYGRHSRRHFGPGIGVHVRYGAGDCWSRWRCADPFPRPGRATGIAYGDDGGAWPWGRIDDRDPRPGGIGRGTAQPRGNSTAVRVSDPQVDLGRGRSEVRRIGDRAQDPVATSTTETRRPDRRIPVWPGDAAQDIGTATTRTEPTRTRNAGDVVRRAETATSTETAVDPRRSNGSGIGRRAIEPAREETGNTDRSSTRTRVIVPPRSSTEERANSTGQSRDSRSIGERARSTEDQSIGRRPLGRSTPQSGLRQEAPRQSEPQNRSTSIGRRSIGSSAEVPSRNEAQSRSAPTNTRVIRSTPPETRPEPGRSAVERARSTAGRDPGNGGTASAGRSSAGSSNGVGSRASSRPTRASGGTDARASTGTARARSTGGSGSDRPGGSSSRIGSGSSRSSSGTARASGGSAGSSRASSGSSRSGGGIGSRARRGG